MLFSNISKEEKFLINILFNENKLETKKFEDIDYDYLVKIASSHLMLPALYVNLKRKNCLKYIPQELNLYLNEIYRLNRARNKILIEELNEISNILNYNNIKYLLLKGSAHILSNIYFDIGERMIGDIDILTSYDQSKKTFKILKENGYKPSIENNFFLNEEKHYVRQCKTDKIFAIEIHKKLLVKNNSEFLNLKKFIKNRNAINKIFIPSLNDQLKHNIYNYQINDYGNSKLSYSYRSFYDTFLLIKNNKINLDLIKPNKYINNYLMIGKELKIPDLTYSNFKERKLDRYRFKFKYSNKILFNIDNFIIIQLIKLKNRPKQFFELITNKKYRKYICKKFLL